MNDLQKRLKALIPGLEYSRETHRQWRDCDQKYRDENPAIGDPDFHQKCIDEYDERISAIKEAIGALNTAIEREQNARCTRCGNMLFETVKKDPCQDHLEIPAFLRKQAD